MQPRKAIIIYESVYHNNTLAVARVIANVLQAPLVKASDASAEMLTAYNLIGFGSGIYNTRHHENLFSLVNTLPQQQGRQAFIFSTNTLGLLSLHKPLKEQLVAKQFSIVSEFTCKGYFKLFNFITINRHRPNTDDLEKAKQFALSL